MIERWPALDYAAEKEVYETVHAYLQVIGKLPVRTIPWVNHSWHVALLVSPRGYRSYPLPVRDQELEILFDCLIGEVRLNSSSGEQTAFAVSGQSVAEFKRQLDQSLAHLGAPVDIDGAPNEIERAIPFHLDKQDRVWDGKIVRRLHAAFLSADRVFRAFRTGFVGKSSPSHLFWGSFDLAVTRFSGRPAPEHPGGFPNLPDPVTREAYSHEVISAGFWPGGGGVDEAAFYAYAYPVPEGLGSARVVPDEVAWHGDLGEFVLPYRAVREAEDSDGALFDFLQSTYRAAADLADWDRDALDIPFGKVGYPRQLDR